MNKLRGRLAIELSKIILPALFLQLSFVSAHAVNCNNLGNNKEKSLVPGLPPLSRALGPRGFLGVHPIATPEITSTLAAHDIMPWEALIFVAPTIEAAREIDIKLTAKSYALKSFYIVDKNVPDLQNIAAADAERIYREVLAKNPMIIEFPIVPLGQEAEAKEVNLAHYLEFFPAEGIDIITKLVSTGPSFRRTGWAYPYQLRGAFFFEKLWESSTYRKIAGVARKHYRNGIRYRGAINEAEFMHSVDLNAATPRNDQDISGNRYRAPSVRQAALDMYRAGRANSFFAEKDGQQLGGIIVFRKGEKGNIIDFETTFYTVIGGIEYSKVASIALFQRLHSLGFTSLPIAMVSSFSAGLKASLVPDQKQWEQINEQFKGRAIDLDMISEWLPPEEKTPQGTPKKHN